MSASIASIRREELIAAARRAGAANALFDAEYNRLKPQGVADYDERMKLIADLYCDAGDVLKKAALAFYAAEVAEQREAQPSNGAPPEAVPF